MDGRSARWGRSQHCNHGLAVAAEPHSQSRVFETRGGTWREGWRNVRARYFAADLVGDELSKPLYRLTFHLDERSFSYGASQSRRGIPLEESTNRLAPTWAHPDTRRSAVSIAVLRFGAKPSAPISIQRSGFARKAEPPISTRSVGEWARRS